MFDKIGEVLPKLEEYFGRPLTKLFLATLLLGAASAALKIAWDSIFKGAFEAAWRLGFTYQSLANVGVSILFIGGTILVTSSRLDAARERRARIRAEALIREARETVDDAIRLRDQTKDTLAQAHLLIEAATIILKAQGTIGQEQADEILALIRESPDFEQSPSPNASSAG